MRRALITLAAVAVIAGAFATAASATVSPTGAKTGTGGAVSFSGVSVNCTSSSFTATFGNPLTPPYTISTDLQLRFATCTGVGSVAITVACANRGVLTATGMTSGGVTPLTITSVSCQFFVTALPTCRATLSGGVPATFNSFASTVTIGTTGQSLTFTGSTCNTLPNGSTTLTSASGGAPVYVVTPATTMSF
jgi:hypothetical protein